jgi:MFS superfamily sulfate permease-like transporter
MVTDVSYDDGLLVFLVLGFLWLVFSYELAVVVGLAWAIAGISRSNALKMAEREEG